MSPAHAVSSDGRGYYPFARSAVAVMLGAALTVFCGCDGPAQGSCPARYSADPERQAKIVEVLGKSQEGGAVVARWGRPIRMCFGAVAPSVVTEEGMLLMDAKLEDARAAARAAHLLTHLVDGLPALVKGQGDCEARVEQALAAEARALALELRLLRELGAPPPEGGPWEVEGIHWAAAPAAREAVLVDYLRSHPDGAPGVDALATGYARRCAAK